MIGKVRNGGERERKERYMKLERGKRRGAKKASKRCSDKRRLDPGLLY